MLWGSSKPSTVRGGAVIPVLILGQELLSVQEFAVGSTCEGFLGCESKREPAPPASEWPCW